MDGKRNILSVPGRFHKENQGFVLVRTDAGWEIGHIGDGDNLRSCRPDGTPYLNDLLAVENRRIKREVNDMLAELWSKDLADYTEAFKELAKMIVKGK